MRIDIGVTGSEWPKWGQNGPLAFDTYLMYLFDAQAVRNGYSIFDARSYKALQGPDMK